MCMALQAWRTMAPQRCAAKFYPFLSLNCAPRSLPGHNPRKGRDQILPSGNTDLGGFRQRHKGCSWSCSSDSRSLFAGAPIKLFFGPTNFWDFGQPNHFNPNMSTLKALNMGSIAVFMANERLVGCLMASWTWRMCILRCPQSTE